MSTLVGSLLSLISIHAPREGCDASLFVISNRPPYFNPRTPRGVRRAGLRSGIQRRPFQSTHPARGATSPAPMGRPGDCNFNPRTPRGVRRAESIDDVWAVIISIHAPREGCDAARVDALADPKNFNPRTPRGVRPGVAGGGHQHPNFNPRTPRGVRPELGPTAGRRPAISIHAPREGCDSSTTTLTTRIKNFNPRTPRGVRRSSPASRTVSHVGFQSTHPARGATCWPPATAAGTERFQSTHPARGAT